MVADLLAANRAFYEAFRQEDVEAMEARWSRRSPVACVHPGWPALIGRDAVLHSWRAIMTGGTPSVRCGAAHAQVLGEAAYVVCEELIGDARLVATNVFVHEDGQWLLVHHHAGPIGPQAEDEDDDEEDEGGAPPGGLN